MATSGTTSFNPSILEILEEAFERAGLEMRTGYDLTTARRSFNFLTAEWANRGLNMWTMALATPIALVSGTATYNLPADTIDVLDGSLRQNNGVASTQSDITISRISMTTYQQLPNKLSPGQPVQYMVTRAVSQPTVTFWPVPNQTSVWVFAYERLRRIEDAGTSAAFTADVPFRFLPALTSGLAYHIACKRAPQMVAALKQRYDEDFEHAQNEDRERASLMFTPSVGYR